MRMGEIVPTGMQGKAIYGEGNYIIDGAAGTGKSTTVLQKIKLLEKNNRVPSDKILVLVKNKSVIKEFDELLKTIGITGLRIKLIDDFEPSLFNKTNWDINSVIDSTWDVAYQINECIITLEKEEKLLSSRVLSNAGSNDIPITKAFEHDSELTYLLREYYKQRTEFIALLENNNNEKNVAKKEQGIELDKYRNLLTKQSLQKKNKKSKRSLINRIFQTSDPDTTLTLGEEAKIRDEVKKKKKKLDSEIVKLSNKHKEKEKKSISNLVIVNKNIRKRILSNEYAGTHSSDDRESRLLNLHINKLFGASASFHTIIVDEGQDVPLSKIHLAWLMAENTILTGDELQKEALDCIGSWNNLGQSKKQFQKRVRKAYLL